MICGRGGGAELVEDGDFAINDSREAQYESIFVRLGIEFEAIRLAMPFVSSEISR
jgi:hypothetical protein